MFRPPALPFCVHTPAEHESMINEMKHHRWRAGRHVILYLVSSLTSRGDGEGELPALRGGSCRCVPYAGHSQLITRDRPRTLKQLVRQAD